MNNALTRRQFVQHSSLVLAGLGAGALRPARSLAAAPTPHLCVASRDAMLRYMGQTDCWAAMKAMGVDGVEVSVRDDLSLPGLQHPEKKYTLADEAGIAQLKADLQAAGRRITALCMYNKFEEQPDREVELGTKAALAAQAIGAKAIRIDVVAHKLPNPEFLELAVATLKKLIVATESTGVSFGIENHGHTSNDPEFLQPLFDRVGSPRLGLTLDTGNFYWFGHPLSKMYQLFERFAPRVVHTHCKSINYPAEQREVQRPMGWEYVKYTCPIDKGDIDFARVVQVLRKAGYSNDLCIEDESLRSFSPEEQAAVLTREARYLREMA
jgi:sugar phosphate isomerase/epimerase